MNATSPRLTARPRRAPSSTSQFSPGSCTSIWTAREKPGPSTSTTLAVARGEDTRNAVSGSPDTSENPDGCAAACVASSSAPPISTAPSVLCRMTLEYRHMRRRTFVQRALGTGLVAPLGAAGVAAAGQPAPARAAAPADIATTVLARDGVAERAAWVARLTRIADPVLTHLAAGTLKQAMPVEQADGANRAPVTHLEALGRLLAGLAPWLALPAADTAEGRTRARLLDLARRAIAQAVDPASPDALNFTIDRQPLVDAAFLAHAIVRAPAALADGIDAATRTRLVAALTSTRTITPSFSNWLLFTAMVE